MGAARKPGSAVRLPSTRPPTAWITTVIAPGVPVAPGSARRRRYDSGVVPGARGREPAVPGSLDRPGQPHAPHQPGPNHIPGQLRSPSPPPEPLPTPDRPDAPRPADHAAAPDELAPWSRADLQHRLERLPPGPPSSPYRPDLSRDQP